MDLLQHFLYIESILVIYLYHLELLTVTGTMGQLPEW